MHEGTEGAARLLAVIVKEAVVITVVVVHLAHEECSTGTRETAQTTTAASTASVSVIHRACAGASALKAQRSMQPSMGVSAQILLIMSAHEKVGCCADCHLVLARVDVNADSHSYES